MAHRRLTLRSLARLRRAAVPLLLALPALAVVADDAWRRGPRLLALDAPHVASYAASFVESLAFWGALALVAARRRGALRHLAALLLVVCATAALGIQRYFYEQYATYLNLDATLFGTSLPQSLGGQIRADLPHLVRALVAPFVLAWALVAVARRWVRPARSRARLAAWVMPVALVAPFVLPCSYAAAQGATPDVIYLHAFGGLVRAMAGGGPKHVRPGLRHPEYVPALAPAPHPARNVLLVVTESVRADVVCVAHEPGCTTTPATDAAAPDRLPLLAMRANDSTTAISIAVLWSGLAPTDSRDAIHSAPLLFDFARAAGVDAAYWTSQHPMFANARLFVRDLATSHQCGATDLEPDAHIDVGAKDELLTERVLRDLGELREPYFAVVQYSNTHFPFRVDPDHAPFQPAENTKDPERAEAFFNYYKNAVHAQDRTIGDLVRGVRATPGGARTVIVYTSDHGEAFREHFQLGHTGSVYDEEVRVPAWVDAPAGTLTGAERASLAAARDVPTFHVDVAPTVLDLLGLGAAPELARFRAKMLGTSLLGARRTAGPMPLTNCTTIWGCAFRNWGVMQGRRKLEAREWDATWHCWDVLDDPREQHDLGAGACGELVGVAERLYGGVPLKSAVVAEGY